MQGPAVSQEVRDTLPSISVFVRVRPLIPKELGSDVLPGLALCSSRPECAPAVALESGKVTVGGFAGVLGQEANNRVVFESCFAERLQTVLCGGTASLFCYGYTGGGKTHTVLGKGEERGMYYLAAQQILSQLRGLSESAGSGEDETLFLHATACEIYNDKVFDLLGAEKLECTLRTDESGTLRVLRPATTTRVDELEKHTSALVGQLTDEQQHEMLQARDRFDDTGLPSAFDGTLHSTATTRTEGLRSLSIFCPEDLESISRSYVQKRAVGASTQHEESSRSHAILRMEVVTESVLRARQALDDARALLPAFSNALDNLTNVACKVLFEKDPYGRYNAIGSGPLPGSSGADPIWDPQDSGGLQKKHFEEPGLWESKHAALLAQKRVIEASMAGAQADVERAGSALAELMGRGPASLGGSLVLVDLAGADYDHRVGGQQRESAAINKSLLALKECLRALANKSSQRPKFRDSKLTRIMEESLAPSAASSRRCRESTSVMVVNVSPAAQLEKVTLNTLRYGQLYAEGARSAVAKEKPGVAAGRAGARSRAA